jgi:hypothetical protein
MACSSAPISVPLRDFDVDIAAVQSSQAVFVKQSFDKPPLSLSSVVLKGTLRYQQASARFTFFVSDTEPCSSQAQGFYLCDPNAPHIQRAGEASFQSGASQPLELTGTRLTQGINSGNLWIGVRLESGLATAGTLEFRNMVAQVAVLP